MMDILIELEDLFYNLKESDSKKEYIKIHDEIENTINEANENEKTQIFEFLKLAIAENEEDAWEYEPFLQLFN